MTSREGRSPRPFVSRLLIGAFLVGLGYAAMAWFGPALVDRFGYERFYARTDPDGCTYQLERKVADWLPGPRMRCLVLEPNGRRHAIDLADPEISTPPEQRIRAALRSEVDEGTDGEE